MTAIALRLGAVMRRTRHLHPAPAALLLIFAGLALAAPAQAVQSFEFTLAALWSIAPYLLFSVGIAAYLRAAGAERLIARVFAGRPVVVIVAATLFGAISPFCSCGVIPLIAALLAAGVALPAVMAFWMSSPLMSPGLFALTVGGLGLEFGLVRLLAAIGMGLLGGFATWGVMRLGLLGEPSREGVGDGGCAGTAVRDPGQTVWAIWREESRRAVFGREASQTLVFLLKWMSLAFALESLMVAYLPMALVGTWLGGDSPWALPLAVVVGVPAYMNGYAAIPLVAGLLQAGMAPGAALAFMTAGGVTSFPAAVAVFALVRRPVFLWYLLLALTGSLLAGAAYLLYTA